MSPLIAVIDNNDAIRAMFTFIARAEGWTISGHSYAEVSLATLQHLKPDLIIVDFVEQEIGEGWELLQLLKMEQTTAAIPIIISTTLAVLPSEIQGYLASRAISVLRKPFAVADFIAVVQLALSEPTPLQLSLNKKLPILIVEDNAKLSESCLMILQLEGYVASSVSNGQLALDAVQNQMYSLIFLDMNMPVMTGQEFIAAYALQPPPHTPVVIFSAQANLIMENLPYFVIGRLLKPFLINELLLLAVQYAEPT